ncbi:hypothetical protein [Thermomonas alba]|uniref:hypothetical protein n=1 Tax=Thermomonas alba TaxID=2888525 RepID=UPI001F047B15|nr:hypothetical protein [Thermomonas alba]
MSKSNPIDIAGPILIYLAIPNLIFLIGFIDLPIAYFLTPLLGWSVWRLIRQTGPIQRTGWLIALLPTLALLILAGLPYGGNTYDWIKHWTLLDLLTDAPWPPHPSIDGHIYWLRYYIAAYLPAALISHWLNWLPGAISLTLWLGLGLSLLFRSLLALVGNDRRRGLLLILLTVLASGLEFLLAPHKIGQTTEWVTAYKLGLQLQISSPLTQLVWAPTQAVPGMLVTLLIGFDRTEGYRQRIVAALCLLLLWTPFAMLGLAPLAAWAILDKQSRNVSSPRTAIALLPFLAMAAISAIYFAGAAQAKPYDFHSLLPRTLLMPKYLLAFLIELGPLLLLLGRQNLRTPPVLISLATLLVLALTTGPKGDLIMRGGIGPVFLLAVLAIRHWLDSPWRTKHTVPRVALIAMLLTSSNEMIYFVTKNFSTPNQCDFQSGIYDRHFTVTELGAMCGAWVLPQYFSPQKPLPLR